MSDVQVFYFGCVGETGHYLWDRNLRRAYDACGFGWRDLDTYFCLGVAPGKPDCPSDQPEGAARLTHARGATVLAFWDRSVDKRRGSHSTFVIEGTHDFDTAKALTQKAFPRVWERYGFDVREGVR
jgi:hypothetical protein